jgi:hypothetical protein
VTPADNTIQKLILDLLVRVNKSNNEVFDKFSSIANNSSIPIIQRYFDEIIPDDIVIEIDRLELNLGVIQYEDLERVFNENLLNSLKNIFDQYFDQNGNITSDSNNLFKISQLPENHLALAKYYLLFGRAPWWASGNSVNINELILKIINTSPNSLRLLLFEIGRNDEVRKRLAFSLQEDIIKKLVKILEPGDAEYIFTYHKTISKLNKEKQTVKVEEKQFNRSLWYLILTYIIYNRGGNFNRREFLKQNIHNVANIHNTSYQILLTLMYNALKVNKLNNEFPNSSVTQLFDNILILVQEDNLIELTVDAKDKKKIKRKSTAENSLEEKLGILHYYLERGSFPLDSFHYSSSDIVSILEFFLDQNPELLIRYFTITNFSDQMIKRLFEFLPTNLYNKLIQLLTPNNFSLKVVDLQKSFILFLIQRQSSTNILLNGEWKLSVLNYIINNTNSLSIPNLITRFIYQIANRLQLSYNNIVTLYQKDLLRQIHTAEYSTSVLRIIADQIDLLVHVNEPSVSSTAIILSDEIQNDDNRYYGIADLLKFVILRGYVPWWGKNYLTKSLAQLMIDLYNFNSKEAISIFKSASAQMIYRNRFIQFFTPDFTKNILQLLWKNEADWNLYNSIGNIFQSIPSILNKPINKATDNIILHAFWKTLLDGSFSGFDKDHFIRLSFLLLRKYHSFDFQDILQLVNASKKQGNPIEIIQQLFDGDQLPFDNDELLIDFTISSNLYFELLLTSLIFGNKKSTKSRKIKEIVDVINYFIKNLSFPPYLQEYLINKKLDYFSFLLGYLYSMDHEKFAQIINSNIQSSVHPVWLSNLLQLNRNLYLLPDVDVKKNIPKDISSFDSILRSVVYRNDILSNNQKTDAVFQLLNYFIYNLSFPKYISDSLNNNSEDFFSYLLDILFSLNLSKYNLLIEKGYKTTKNPSWFYTILENNDLSPFPSFDLIVRSAVFNYNDLPNDQKVNSILQLINYYIDNLSFPQSILASLKNKPEDFFSYLLSILYSLDQSKHSQIIKQGYSTSQKPTWFYSILEKNNFNLFYSFESILLSKVYNNNELSKDQQINSIFQLINYFIDNLSFPQSILTSLKNKPEDFFSYLLSILYSLDQSKHSQIIEQGYSTSQKPTWFYSILEKNNFNQFSSYESILQSTVYNNNELSKDQQISSVFQLINYFIDNLSFPSYLSVSLENKPEEFFSYLLGILYSLDQLKHTELIEKGYSTNKNPSWFYTILENNNFLKFSNKVSLNATSELYDFDQWVNLVIYQNKEISNELKGSEIVKIITYFIDNLSFPNHFPEYLKNKQHLFFSHLLGLLFSLNQAKYIEIINAVLHTLNKPIWFINLVHNIKKQINFSTLGINSIVTADLPYVDTDLAPYFVNDNIFIYTLLGFKPVTSQKFSVTFITNETSTLLLSLLSNKKLPVKYEFLARYDFSFLITILFRFLFTNNEILFNQVLLKFASFPSSTRILLFKLFPGKTNHPTDELITERLIPYITVEVDSQKKVLEKDSLFKNNKISTTVSNKLNEWINSQLLNEGINREGILLNLLTFFLQNGKFYDSFSSFTGSYVNELLRILILEIARFDSKKLVTILSFDNNNIDAKIIVLNLFSQGATIEERSVHTILQSFNSELPISNITSESLNEFDVHNINPLIENLPFNEVGIRDFFKKTLGVEIVSDKLLLDNSINIVIYYLLHKKKEPQFKKITEDSFIVYLKEILWFIYAEQPAILRDLLTSSSYPLNNKVSLLALYSQTSDKKDTATRFYLQPIIETEIFKFIESMVDKKIANRDFKDLVNNVLKEKLVGKNIPILKLLQYVQSSDLMDDFIQTQLAQEATKKINKLQSAFLKQVIALFNAALPNFKDRNEFSNILIRFNSYILSEAHLIVSIDIYLRKLIQFLLYQNRTRAIYFFSKFILYTDNVNLSFSTDYAIIVNKIRKIFKEFINSSDLAIAAEKDTANDSRDKELLDKINEVVADILVDEKDTIPENVDPKLLDEDFVESKESIYINNAGLVLFNPYITTFFSKLGITEHGKFKDEESTFRAIHLLQLLVTDAAYEEHELVLNKILCNLPVSSPIPMDIVLKPAEKLLAKELVEITMKRWKKGSSGSKESFRASFINRDGRLSMVNEEWHLKVEQRGYDVILNTLPWSFGMIKLPWMLKPLIVEWV